MSNSILNKRMGRITFLLTSVAIVVLSGGAALLQHAHAENRHLSFAVEYSLAVLAVIWLRSLERRLEDAGLPRWSFWPYFLFVFTACFGAHAHRMTNGPRTLALFLLLQIPAFLLQSKPAPGEALPGAAGQQAARGYPKYLKPVGRFVFLLRVLLIAGFSAAFLHLAQRMDPGAARWEIALGLVILAFVWIYNVEARVLDAQLPSWASALYCLIVPVACCLPLLVHHFSLRLGLSLFVLLQIPTLFVKSEPMPAEPASPESKRARPAEPLNGFEFAIYIVLITGLWHILHLLRGDVGGGTWSLALDLALDAGSLSLCLAWAVCVKGRLKDLGLTRWRLDFCFTVLILCLLPFAFRILTFPHALVLFVVLQIPAMFVGKRFIPAGLLPVDADS